MEKGGEGLNVINEAGSEQSSNDRKKERKRELEY